MSRPPDFFKNARQQPPKGLDSNGMPEERRVNGYLVTPPTRWTKDANGRTLGLNSAAWRKLRKQVLAEVPLCEYCPPGVITPATEVDHANFDPADNSRENLKSTCKPCHSIRTMASLYGRPARMGCDAAGNPINPMHHWNRATVEAAGRLAEDVLGKSPATDGDKPTCSTSFDAHCLKNRQP